MQQITWSVLESWPHCLSGFEGGKSIFFLVSTSENAEPHLGMRKLLESGSISLALNPSDLFLSGPL